MLDIKMSATAKMSHYVLPPKLGLECPAISMPNEGVWFYGMSTGYPEPYAQYQPALIPPPAGSDLLEEWEVFFGLAQRLGLDLSQCWVIGDQHRDMEAGRSAGCRTILFSRPGTRADECKKAPDHTVDSFGQAVEVIGLAVSEG